jgi:hypothetical protein
VPMAASSSASPAKAPQLEGVVYCSQRTVRGDMVFRADTLAPVFDECVQLRFCRLEGDAVFQSRYDIQDVDPALPSRTRVEPEGQPNLGAVIHDVGPGWHNANDFVEAALDFHLLSNERSSSKRCSPQFVRENCDRWR